MAKGLYTQGICVLLSKPVSTADIQERLKGFDLVGQHESMEDDDAPVTLVFDFRPEVNGHLLVTPANCLWPDDMGDPDESPDTAAVRETLEEGGIQATIEGLLGVQSLRREGWVALIFMCRYASGVPAHDGGVETDGAAFFTLEEMDAFDEPFEPWCAWLVRRVLRGQYRLIPPEAENPYRPRMAFF